MKIFFLLITKTETILAANKQTNKSQRKPKNKRKKKKKQPGQAGDPSQKKIAETKLELKTKGFT
jgi:hypothetical protein